MLYAGHEERENFSKQESDYIKENLVPVRRHKTVWTQVLKKSSPFKALPQGPPRKMVYDGEMCLEMEPVPGKHLARELIITTRHNQKLYGVFLIYMFIVLLIPTFFRVGFGYPPFGDWHEVPIYIFLFFSSVTFNLQNMFFINLAYVDSARRLFLMRSLSALLSVHKDFSFPFLHKTPLIDIFDPASLNSWYNLRNIFMDVGKRYEDKIYLYFSVVILGYAVLALWFVMLILGLIQLDTIDVNLQAVMVGNMLVVVFIYICLVLMNGANINDHFKIHRDLLMKNKTHYANAETYKNHLNSDLRYVNPMLSYAATKFFCYPREFGKLMHKLTLTTDSLYNKLENDEIKHPYKILGAKVTWILIGRVATLLVSLCGFIIQYYTNAFKIGGSNIE
mmetsp:Transcript_62398/g.71558  ORF Transcript_62398/g.71558 Transcript_62398/m.71558 type:complete len:392 (-) Transcript_62398:276-1451(-)